MPIHNSTAIDEFNKNIWIDPCLICEFELALNHVVQPLGSQLSLNDTAQDPPDTSDHNHTCKLQVPNAMNHDIDSDLFFDP